MGVHGRPQEKDLLDQKPLSMEGFSFGDLGQRVKFFASPLYRDYVETRSRARLLAMQQAETQERREELLASLVASVENLEGDGGHLQQQAAWARGLFSAAVAPATRLSFALASDAAERVEFACQFKVLPSDGICWRAVRCAAGLVEVPREVTFDEFLHMVALVQEGGARSGGKKMKKAANMKKKGGARKSVVNPLVGAVCDFQAEVVWWSGAPESAWYRPLMQAVGAAKMGVPRWQTEDFAPDAVPEEHTPALSKALGRLFALKPPLWVVSLREKVADRKAKQAAPPGATAAEAAPEVALPAAAAPGTAASPRSSAASAVGAAALAPASAAVAPGPKAKGCAKAGEAAAAAGRPSVGDVVILDDSVGVACSNQEIAYFLFCPSVIRSSMFLFLFCLCLCIVE